jgi:hypothetical protein
VGKGKSADVYLEVRKRRGIYFFNETSACGLFSCASTNEIKSKTDRQYTKVESCL